MTPHEAVKQINTETDVARQVQRRMWGVIQERVIDIEPWYMSRQAFYHRFILPLTHAVARGMITEEDATQSILDALASTDEQRSWRWTQSNKKPSREEQATIDKRHAAQREIDNLMMKLLDMH
jgi:hypothetical protein